MITRRTLLTRLLVLVAALSMLAVACGGTDEGEPTATDTATEAETTPPEDEGTAEPTEEMTAAEDEYAVADETTDVTLVLDFLPGGVHAGLYSAQAEGYFEEANLNVDIQTPTSTADTLRLVTSGQSAFGIAPLADVASLRADGEPIRAFMALEQVPLAALISTEAIGYSDPGELGGGTVGVTGVPSDELIARFILESSGVDPQTVEFVTIGFNAVQNLISQQVDAAIGFWNAEAVRLELQGETPVIWRPDEYGAPTYPELVFFASETTLSEDADVVQAFVDATRRGYGLMLEDQETAVQHLVDLTEGSDPDIISAEIDALEGTFTDDSGDFGTVTSAEFAEWADWAAEVGVIEQIPEDLVDESFTS